MTTTRGPILLAALLALLAACGGGQAGASTPAGATPAAAGSAGAGAATAKPSTGAGVPAGATNIAITGDKPFTVTSPGVCKISTLTGADDYSVSFETDGDDLWLLKMSVRKYAGPAAYEVVPGETVGKAQVKLSDLKGGGADSVRGGSLTIGEGGTSGSVEADLEGAAGKVHVSGAFSCAMA